MGNTLYKWGAMKELVLDPFCGCNIFTVTPILTKNTNIRRIWAHFNNIAHLRMKWTDQTTQNLANLEGYPSNKKAPEMKRNKKERIW